jgi:hypothetical protein
MSAVVKLSEVRKSFGALEVLKACPSKWKRGTLP